LCAYYRRKQLICPSSYLPTAKPKSVKSAGRVFVAKILLNMHESVSESVKNDVGLRVT
jgi:hypothetical protein